MLLDYIKGNIFLMILGVIVIAATIFVGIDVIKKQQEINKYQSEVTDIQSKAKSFTKFPYELSAANEERARENAEGAQAALDQALVNINRRYGLNTEVPRTMSPLAVRQLLRQESKRMENKLRHKEIKVAGSLGDFTFAPFMDNDFFPTSEEILLILRQVDIMNEIVELLSESGVASVTRINRGSLKPIRLDLYSYIEYEIDVEGDYDKVIRLLNSLHDAEYFFVVRDVDVMEQGDQVSALLNTTRGDRRTIIDPATGQEVPRYLPQADRIAFKEPAMVDVKITIEYYEFHDREG